VEKLISLNTVIVWPVFLSLSFMATPFMTLVFGENWRPAGEIFPWILLAQGILSMLPQPEQILLPYGKVKRIFAVRCAGALFAVSVGAYGASLGLEAFAICRVAATSFLTVLVFFSIKPFIALQAWRLIAVYLRSGLVAVIASIPAAIFYFTEQETMTLQGLVLVVAACGLFWLGGIAITRHFVWIEGLRMAGSAMGRG
jgi:O-antigen/teichoic acid export membrane protein